jgi:hypothetical protein
MKKGIISAIFLCGTYARYAIIYLVFLIMGGLILPPLKSISITMHPAIILRVYTGNP